MTVQFCRIYTNTVDAKERILLDPGLWNERCVEICTVQGVWPSTGLARESVLSEALG
jgi:hypothetical protein